MINWGMGGPQDNALAYFKFGANMGSQLRERKEQREAATREAEGRSALAQYATKPTDEGFAAAVQHDPRTAFTIRQGAQEQAANEQTASRARLKELADLFDDATPENYGQRVAMAGQLGVDVSTVPQQFDPQWVQQQGALMKFMSSDEGIEALSTAGKIAVDQGLKPGTEEFNKRVTEIWLAGESKPYVVGGETRLYTPRLGGAGDAKGSIPPGAIEALKKDPSLAEQFKAKYGIDPTEILGGQTGSAPSGDFQAAFANGI